MIEDKVSRQELERIRREIASEGEEIDFKEVFKFSDTHDKLELVKDIVALANTRGGYIVFGVKEEHGKFEFQGLDSRSDEIKHENILDFMRNYVNFKVNIAVGVHELNDEMFYLIYVDKHMEDELISFTKDGSYVRENFKGKKQNKIVFKKYEMYGRKGCENTIVNHDTQFKKLRSSKDSIITNIDSIESPYDYYVEREDTLDDFLKILNNNIPCVQINGLGGIGKTSFIYSFCKKVLNNEIQIKEFKPIYIIWITGKLTIFKPTGTIEKLKKMEINYDEFVDELVHTLGIQLETEDKDKINNIIYDSLETYPSLVIIDNMETIVDKDINDFLMHIPKNSKVILTTRENMEDLSYRRINISGFSKKQFHEYCLNQFKIFDVNKEIEEDQISSYENELYEKTQGSPIITNMIIYKICSGSNPELLIENINSIDDSESYYDKVMEFCFKDTFDSLTQRDKEVLYILSTADSNDVGFQIQDIEYVLDKKYSRNSINDSIMKLHQLSFCNRKRNEYIAPSLVKVFANRELTRSSNVNTKEIGEKLKDFYKKKEHFQNQASTYYEHAKAFTFDEKEIAEEVKELIDEYEIQDDYEIFDKKYSQLIVKKPTYAFPYFKRALKEKNIGASHDTVRNFFNKAVEYDPKEDHYWTEYAFYEESIQNRELAKRYFENALKINPNNVSAHHGYAVCLKKMYNGKKEYNDEFDKIIEHFEKAYFLENKRYENRHNAKNAHAHAGYLMSVGKLNEAEAVCRKGLEYQTNNQALRSLLGIIQKKIDPNFMSEKRISNTKKGLFSNLSKEDAIKIIEMTENKNYSNNN